MKAVIGVGLVFILGALGTALVFMLRGSGDSGHTGRRMLKALRIRVFLSMGLLAFIWFGYWMGWIQPHRY